MDCLITIRMTPIERCNIANRMPLGARRKLTGALFIQQGHYPTLVKFSRDYVEVQFIAAPARVAPLGGWQPAAVKTTRRKAADACFRARS